MTTEVVVYDAVLVVFTHSHIPNQISVDSALLSSSAVAFCLLSIQNTSFSSFSLMQSHALVFLNKRRMVYPTYNIKLKTLL
jgi:hypothetical protein